MLNFPKHWLRPDAVSSALLPASWLFAAVSAARRALYGAGILRSTRLRVPVIVVGNVTVGGTGKTPLVLALLEDLRRSGRRPGVILRGYGAAAAGVAEVCAGDDPRAAGDEAVLLAVRSGCPVFRGRDRVAAASALLERHPDCDLIVSDDGLQHYRLARDIEIAVEDARGHGNGRMLPAGPLREPGNRKVDALVLNGEPHPERAAAIARLKYFRMQLVPDGWYELGKAPIEVEHSIDPKALAGARLHALAGIGAPQRFFRTLEELGIRAVEHAFPDHHAFSADDLRFDACDAVLMTEKDAVKCLQLARPVPCYVLRVQARLDPSFFEFIRTRLQGVRHGHPAA